eukprot:3401069-Pleurochrysis_carterae.AAC.2
MQAQEKAEETESRVQASRKPSRIERKGPVQQNVKYHNGRKKIAERTTMQTSKQGLLLSPCTASRGAAARRGQARACARTVRQRRRVGAQRLGWRCSNVGSYC